MPVYRSRTSTHGRNMAGARGLWRATGMKDSDFGKPIIAVVNSFTQFVPGHVHLKDLGQLVAREIEAAGGVAKEFNTIAVDDGIAMGHGGMLYSLPSRELIADSVEYMVEAHQADALVCISNCDKITPGMLLAAMRLNIPTVFVSGDDHRVYEVDRALGAFHHDLAGLHRAARHEHSRDVQPHRGDQHPGRDLVAVGDADQRVRAVRVDHVLDRVSDELAAGQRVQHPAVAHR